MNVDQRAPVIEATLFFELPWDTGLDLVHAWTYESGEPWLGWDLESMGALIGVPGPIPAGTRPLYRLVFRRTLGRAREAHEAVERAFFHWIHTDLGLSRRFLRRLRLLSPKHPRRQARTVVGVTHYRDASSHNREIQGDDGVHEAVSATNDFLTAYGLASDDPLVGPVPLTQLPAVAPMLRVVASDEGPVGLRSETGVHPWQQRMLAIPRTEDDLDLSAFIFDAWHRRKDPTFPLLALLNSARRDLLDGRHSAAVLNAGTAVEMLVESTLRRGWHAAKLDQTRLEGAIQSGFRSQLEVHLPRVLDIAVDLQDDTTEPGAWWQAGYALRNAVVHHARRPTSTEAHGAVATSFEFAAFVGRALEGRPETQSLQGLLPTRRVEATRYAFIMGE